MQLRSKEEIEKAIQLRESILNDGLSLKEAKKFIDRILDVIKTAKEQIMALFEETKKNQAELEKRIENTVAEVNLRKGARGEKGDRGPEGKKGADGRDGKNGESIVGSQGEKGKDGRNGSPDSSEEIVDKINQLPIDNDKLKIEKEHIKGLIEELKALRAELGAKGSGGVTNLRIQQAFKYILKTEQPSGTIDGANLSYTVTQPIFTVLSFSLNGETIAQLPNYTISGKTITFSSALPAAYSGKDFEIKFI